MIPNRYLIRDFFFVKKIVKENSETERSNCEKKVQKIPGGGGHIWETQHRGTGLPAL